MPRYESHNQFELFGLVIESEEFLPELPAIQSATRLVPQITIRRSIDGADAWRPLRPAVRWTFPSGRDYLSSHKTENGYVLNFPGLADFYVDHQGKNIQFLAGAGIPPESIRHLLLDAVIPLVLGLSGHDVLHASAVVTTDGGCAFIAETGTGKSTLAASFSNVGHSVITEDCLVLEVRDSGVRAWPSYPGFRLWQDSIDELRTAATARTLPLAHYTAKRRLLSGKFATKSHPLSAIYCLKRPLKSIGENVNEPRVEELSGSERVISIVHHLFCIDPHEPALLEKQFKFIASIAAKLSILSLTVPDDFSRLDEVREAVLSDLRTRAAAVTN